MTIEEKNKWQTISKQLLLLHKSFMDWQFTEVEKVRGPINNPATRLQLLLGDDEFQWFRWMSQLVTQIDHVLDLRDPLTGDQWEQHQAEWRQTFRTHTGPDFQNKLKQIGQKSPNLNTNYTAIVSSIEGH